VPTSARAQVLRHGPGLPLDSDLPEIAYNRGDVLTYGHSLSNKLCRSGVGEFGVMVSLVMDDSTPHKAKRAKRITLLDS
jgi:hypothetical protein